MKHLGIQAWKGGVLAFALMLSTAASAADPQVEALLAKMRHAYSTTKAATYTTERQFGPALLLNSFTYESPSKIRVEITSSTKGAMKGALIKVSDGKTIHFKLPNATEYTEAPYSIDAFSKDLPINLESLCFFDWAKQLSTAKGMNMEHSTFKITPNQDWNGKKWTVLQETAVQQKVVCQYFIDPKTYFIWRTIVKPMPGGPAGANMDCKILKLNTAPKIDESTFKVVKTIKV